LEIIPKYALLIDNIQCQTTFKFNLLIYENNITFGLVYYLNVKNISIRFIEWKTCKLKRNNKFITVIFIILTHNSLILVLKPEKPNFSLSRNKPTSFSNYFWVSISKYAFPPQ